MGRIIFITGGVRAGKSAFAQSIAEARPGKRVFIATAEALDADMSARIHRHQQDREDRGWSTVEEPLDLARAIRACGDAEVVLVDCLTLWISNRMHAFEQSESDVVAICNEVIDACAGIPGDVIFVSNEVGLGVMPDNRLARRYADLLGRCNQMIAAAADEVCLLVSGLPLRLKAGKNQ